MKALSLFAFTFCLFVLCFSLAPTALGSPRQAWPPWPEPTLAGYRFNGWYPPLLPPPIGFENAQVQESWSEYALVRDSFALSAVVVPAVDSTGRTVFTGRGGTLRFWFCGDWTSYGQGGDGPGTYARLLEAVDLSGNKPKVRWTLYFSESGDQIFLSGLGGSGMAQDFLSADVGFVTGEWQMITLTYSAEVSELWLGDQLVAQGDGVPVPEQGQESSQALVIGSDLEMTAPAGGQFEEFTTFDYWPDAEQLAFYFNGVSRQVFLGTVGTPEEEAAKQELLAAMYPQPLLLMDEGGGLLLGYNYSTNQLWLEIVGVTNSVAEFKIHTPTNAPYDLFMTTNLNVSYSGLNGTNWLFEVRKDAGQTNFWRSIGTNSIAFYRLGTTNDTDADGLTDAFENLVSHTDCDVTDSDGDGLTDGAEVIVHNLDPLSMDTDGDNVIDQPFGVAITQPAAGSVLP